MKMNSLQRTFLSFFVLVLCFSAAYGQFSGSTTYDFRDGTIITAGKSANDSLFLSGTYSLHGTTYGLNMKVGGTIKIVVAGSRTIRFLGSKYSSLFITGKTKSGVALEPNSKATLVTNDLADTYDFVYRGAADTLSFTTVAPGSDLYLPTIQVIPIQLGSDIALAAAAKNILYFFDLRNLSIIPAGGTATIEKGLFKIEAGASNAYGYNGTQHGSVLKTGNKITLKVAGNSYIKIGGCQYSSGTIAISSATGAFDKVSQASKTALCYDADGSTVDFLYVGTAGTVVLDFTGTTYIPIIEIFPVPYTVELTPWVLKTGTITVNGTVITLTAGANSSANAIVALSAGTVISATSTIASIRINLGGSALTSFTPSVTGDIASAIVSNDSLRITYTGTNSIPTSYTMVVADNSVVAAAVAGKTYTYNFADGSVMPQIGYASLRYPTFFTKDNLVNMKSNTVTFSKQFGYHDNTHGAVLFPGNSFDMTVAGSATFTYTTCQYGSATDAVFEFKNAAGTILGYCDAKDNSAVDASPRSFTYTGDKGVITATLKSTSYPSAEVYMHGLSIENAAKIQTSNGKIDVWDFGAAKLDTNIYNNRLDSAIINSWYAVSITPGSAGAVLPASCMAGVLTWVGGTNDRLRTSNTKLTRYDSNVAGGTDYTGRVYVNGAGVVGRFMSLTLSADDELTIVEKTDAGGKINFQYVADPAAQTDVVPVTLDIDTLTFVAKAAGTYHIFDNLGKPSYFRIFRKDATYVTINGTVDATAAAGIPAGYGITLKNSAGKTWNTVVLSNTFMIKVPAGYTYSLSLSNANGYVINNGFSINVTQATTTYNIVIKKVEIYNVSGAISGLDSSKISKLTLAYTPDPAANKIFVPTPVANASAKTYAVQLEPNCKYTITAKGVNDYSLSIDSMRIRQVDSIANIVFVAKPVYNVTINTTGLTAEQIAKLSITFTNLNEAGYVYNFSSVIGITLRNGTYAITCSGLDSLPLQMALTSNLKVAGDAISKTLAFSPVTNWSFEDRTIANGAPTYKGMLLSGTVYNEIAKGHILARVGGTIKVPVNVGYKVNITYYYSAAFSISGNDTIRTATASTGILEYAEYKYTGTVAGYVTIAAGLGTTYFTEISVSEILPYRQIIYVGTDKEFKTINDALSAVVKMDRASTDRVTVMIDPGNYEEMLVVTSANVTLKNAAVTPNIALTNKGVGIDASAVRITSYYGHGYNYYSMKNNQKWDADVLKVNKENGYQLYANTGSGTTNGSNWNATVVISANGFIAEDIIFENSYNQYISKKESEDVVVMWTTGGKGIRPTDIGNTAVQNRSFVERAAAIAITNNTDKVIMNKCRVIGRQDSYYGGTGVRVVIYKGAMMGAVDYLFGGMTAVFYKTDLVMNVSDVAGDASYLTAAQQSSGRGYLMFECNVKSATPVTESASTFIAKPGYFGRPWAATTSEVVFYNTTIDISDFTGFVGKSLISPAGWSNSLSGESNKMYEYGTIEKSGENNQASRVAWATKLSVPTLTDGTVISTLNFTKGSDGWDPLPLLIANDPSVKVPQIHSISSVTVFPNPATEYVTIQRADSKPANMAIYDMKGSKVLSKALNSDSETTDITGLSKGIYVIIINNEKYKLVVR